MNTNIKKGDSQKNLIFLHGSSSSSRVFDKVFTDPDIPYNMISIDLPGHGESEQQNDYSFKTLLDQVHGLMTEINGPKILLGNSFGGHMAIELSPKVQDLQGLVIFGTPPLRKPINPEEAFLPFPSIATIFTENPSSKDVEITFDAAVSNKQVVSLLIEDFSKTDPKVRLALAQDFSDSNSFGDQAAIFCHSSFKRFIIHGKKDPSVNLEYLKKLQQEAIHPFDIVELTDCGHYPSIEQPGLFLNELKLICRKTFLD